MKKTTKKTIRTAKVGHVNVEVPKKKTTSRAALSAGLSDLSRKLAAGKVTPQIAAPAGSTPLGMKPARGEPIVKGKPAGSKQETAAVTASPAKGTGKLRQDPAVAAVTPAKPDTSKLAGTIYPAIVEPTTEEMDRRKGLVAGISAVVTAVDASPKAPAAAKTAAKTPDVVAPAPVTLKSLEAALDAGYKKMDALLSDYEKTVRDVLRLEIQIETLASAPIVK